VGCQFELVYGEADDEHAEETLNLAGVEEDNAQRQGARGAQNWDEAGIQRPHAETNDHSVAKLPMQSSETKTIQR
jgi:hypothetical protein